MNLGLALRARAARIEGQKARRDSNPGGERLPKGLGGQDARATAATLGPSQNNLGNALWAQAAWTEGPKAANDAVKS